VGNHMQLTENVGICISADFVCMIVKKNYK